MKKLGLYIHIPFCVKKCHYCDFLSAPATSKVQKSYMEVLRKEIKEKATEYSQWEADTVFFGGGTPTSVPFEEIVQVMELLKQVAKDRLVVMVTHNPDLAKEYATRIVKLRDGKIIDDTNPYEVDEKKLMYLIMLLLCTKSLYCRKRRW